MAAGAQVEHYWQDLPGPVWFMAGPIYAEQVAGAVDGAVFVELGAWKGRSAAFMGVEIVNSGKAIEFHTVDTWEGSIGESEHDDDPDVQAGSLYEVFVANIAPVAQYVNPIRSRSDAAADRFADGSVDFVFVDAGHTYEDVSRDLAAWWPKLKQGGVIAGDDWPFRDSSTGELSVQKAVKTFFRNPRHLHPIALRVGEPYDYWTQWVVRKDGTVAANAVAKATSFASKAAHAAVRRVGQRLRSPGTRV